MPVSHFKKVFLLVIDDIINFLNRVIETKNESFPIGSLLLSKAGWQSHFISKGDNLERIRYDMGTTPKSFNLGILGMPGFVEKKTNTF